MSESTYVQECLESLMLLALAHPEAIGPSHAAVIQELGDWVFNQGGRLDPAQRQQVMQVFEEFSYLLV